MTTLATYSPEDITILLGGVYQLTGLADGSFLSISEEEARFKTVVTADGRATRTQSHNPTHVVSLTLHSMADDNQILSALAAADKRLHSATIPFMMKDGLGTTTFYAPLCWVESVADVTLATGVEAREWTLRTVGATGLIGGNEGGGVVDTNLAALGFISADFAGLLD